jgi:hypothetical protein
MAMGVTLAEMLQSLRAESNLSLLPGHTAPQRDAHVQLLQRVQEELYVQHSWPHLIIEREVPLLFATQNYEYPADMQFDFIERAWVKDANRWLPMEYGITPDDYNVYNDDAYRTYPPVKWEHWTDNVDQFRVWPIPDKAGAVRFRGRKKLARLVEDTDKATLDGTLIVLYAASELLAQAKNELAQTKMQKAQAYLQRLRARQGGRTETFVIGGGAPAPRGRVGLDFIPPGYGNGS